MSSNMSSNDTDASQIICRLVVENFVGDREYIWTSSSASYMTELTENAERLKAIIGKRFYTVEFFKKDPLPGHWEVVSYVL
jgi:hypothetical protein